MTQPYPSIAGKCSNAFALVGVPEQALGGLPWVWIDFGR